MGCVISPLLHIARFQELPHQEEKGFILDAFAQQVNENMVVKTVKAALNVSLDNPLCATKSQLNFL